MGKDEPTIQRRNVLNAFHNDLDASGQPAKHDFRYIKTDNSPGEKIGVTKWATRLADIVQEKKDDKPGQKPKKDFYNVKYNNVILIKETPFSKKPKALKFRLFTHYRPHGTETWLRVIHPTD
ncbi:hypothetical protein BWI93_10215 [Siphonobacter sp. BAB-5385]|uniref:hypothetical protein n=1 Tax=Siphonobacter sp. BAB-5385 TaxID=1864822 RepID=UPI000B9DD57E|nr:hypothetical protein [Siphonobacter sp. BAB-5385]OZI08232.1 hypothetical protein BWI93_10215 [Siphonobacter sp. BAB-5385]